MQKEKCNLHTTPSSDMHTRGFTGKSLSSHDVVASTLQLVVELVQARAFARILPLADAFNKVVGLGTLLARIGLDECPVVEHTLREGLAGGLGTQGLGEAEGLLDGQVGLDSVHWSTRALLLGDDLTTACVHSGVHTTQGILGASDLDKENRLLETRAGQQERGVQDTAGGGDDLSTTTVNGISVEHNIMDVEADAAHVLFSEHTLLGGPLHASDDRVLDLIQVLHTLGDVNNHVGTGSLGTEAPDLGGGGLVVLVVVHKELDAILGVAVSVDLAIFNVLGHAVGHGDSLHVQTVVLVGRLGQSHDGGLHGNSLTKLHNWVSNPEGRARAVLLLQVLEADLDVELTATGNNVLTRFGGVAVDKRVGLGKALHAFHQLGKILGILALNSNLHDRGDGVLHHAEVVGTFVAGNSTRLDQVLIDANKSDGVTARHVLNGLRVAAHHEHGTLDGLDVQVLLLAGNVVGTHDTDLLASLDGTTIHTAEGVEAALVRGGHHLGDVHHQGTSRVARADGLSRSIIKRTLVQSLDTVALRRNGGGQVEDHHVQESIGCGEPQLHDALEQLLLAELLVVILESDAKTGKHLPQLLVLLVHASSEDLGNRLHDEEAESTVQGAAIAGGTLGGPLLGLGVKVVVTPQLAEHLSLRDTELLGVDAGEALQSETPAVEAGTEGNTALVRVELDLADGLILVGGQDDVDGLDGTLEVLVGLLGVKLQLQESAIQLVHHEHRADTLGHSLAQHGLGLHADTLDAVDDDKGTVGDTESGSHLRGEVNVAWGVNQVDQESDVDGVPLGLGERLEVRDAVLGDLEVQGDTGGLDGDAAVLLVLAGVRETGVASGGRGNDTGALHEGVGKGGLAVVHVSDHGHGADVLLEVHDAAHLLDGKVHHDESV